MMEMQKEIRFLLKKLMSGDLSTSRGGELQEVNSQTTLKVNSNGYLTKNSRNFLLINHSKEGENILSSTRREINTNEFTSKKNELINEKLAEQEQTDYNGNQHYSTA
jgi:hypothetical protein